MKRSPLKRVVKRIDNIAGAESRTIIYIIAEIAKANNLKPYIYFEYLLTEIPKHLDVLILYLVVRIWKGALCSAYALELSNVVFWICANDILCHLSQCY